MVHAGAHFCTYGLLYLGPTISSTKVYTIDIELFKALSIKEMKYFILYFLYHSGIILMIPDYSSNFF